MKIDRGLRIGDQLAALDAFGVGIEDKAVCVRALQQDEPRPGQIVADVPVPFDYPREPALRADACFARLCGDLSQQLRGVST